MQPMFTAESSVIRTRFYFGDDNGVIVGEDAVRFAKINKTNHRHIKANKKVKLEFKKKD